MDHMLRDTAAGKPGTITHVGLGTFVDPRQDGAKANDVTEDDIVELVTFDGEEYLYYRSVPIDVAIIRGTTADEDGNITTEREALDSNTLAMAQGCTQLRWHGDRTGRANHGVRNAHRSRRHSPRRPGRHRG